MSNPITITVQNENSKPTFIIRKDGKAIGRFTASLSERSDKRAGSAFAAIVMRIVTGFPVNVVGKMLLVDGESIVGDNIVTEALRNLANDPFYAGQVPMTNSNVYHVLEKEGVRFLDDKGLRISAHPAYTASRYQVTYAKYAN